MSNGIICLCGSTKFYKLFDQMNYWLTINDYIVLSIGCHSQSDYSLGIEEIMSHKIMLDHLHKEKIAMADAILVLDKNAYVGDSTRSEIEYAKQLGKHILYYSKHQHLNLKYESIAKRQLEIPPQSESSTEKGESEK